MISVWPRAAAMRRHLAQAADRVGPERSPLEAGRHAHLQRRAAPVGLRARDALDLRRHVGADAHVVACDFTGEITVAPVQLQVTLSGRLVLRKSPVYDADDGRERHLVSPQRLDDLGLAGNVLFQIEVYIDLQFAGAEPRAMKLRNGLQVVVEAVGKAVARDGVEGGTTNGDGHSKPRSAARSSPGPGLPQPRCPGCRRYRR
jgi:hypothetical protein